MNGIENITSANTNTANTTSSSTTKTLGKNDFLKMLVAQLQNQDPLNPLDGTDFAAQLAQFSSLEQLTTMNAQLGSLGLYQMTASNVQAVNLIGKEISALGANSVTIDNASANLSYELPGDAKSVVVNIYNEAGELVKTIENGQQKEGVNSVTLRSSDVSPGNYTFAVEATDVAGNSLPVNTMVTGKVTAVHFKDNDILLTVDGRDINFSDVVAVKDAPSI